MTKEEHETDDRCDVCGSDGGDEYGLKDCVGFVTRDGRDAGRICVDCAVEQLLLFEPNEEGVAVSQS